MIVGIDETGDYSDGTRTWIAAVLVRPSSLEQVEVALQRWERDTRQRLGLANELKGAKIDLGAAESFVADVVRAGDGGSVRWTAFAVDVDSQNMEAMAEQRHLLADGYSSWADMQRRSMDPSRRKFERQLRHWEGWVRARSSRQMLKLTALATTLPTLLEWSFGLSIAGGYDEELLDLAFYIDRGYVKTAELVIWRDILRSVFMSRTLSRPIPFSSEWPVDHPVLKAFVERSRGEGFELKSDFKNRIDFHDSVATPVIRVADVVAAVVRRGVDDGPLSNALSMLRSRRLDVFPYTLLQWTGTGRTLDYSPHVDPRTRGGHQG